MKHVYLLMLAAGIIFGSLSTLAVTGCSKAADRTVTIQQIQHRDLHDGQFRIITSELPKNAIKERKDTGPAGGPKTTIELAVDQEFEIVIRPRSK